MLKARTELCRLLPVAGLICLSLFTQRQPLLTYRCENGKISFESDAKLEQIEAESNKLKGALDPNAHTFAWTVDARSFEGFNSQLQQEHFNENYIEYTRYPRLSFTGKIIEKVDFGQNGKITIRAKGNLNVHGVDQERIIRCELDINGSKIKVKSRFTVALADHNISIPRIVNQKIAEEVLVQVDAEMLATQK